MLFYSWLIGVLFCCFWAEAQDSETLVLKFEPTYNNQDLLSENSLHIYQGASITFSRFKFYISNIELWEDETLVWKASNSYHLIDAENSISLSLSLQIPQKKTYNQLKFNLGIDSLTSVSGAMGGDLDPTNGMYWAWNSGYINFKLEGQSTHCPARKNKFQYHLGGYSGNFNNLQTITLNFKQSTTISIGIALEKFLEELDMQQQHSIMSPSLEAVKLAQTAATTFYVLNKN